MKKTIVILSVLFASCSSKPKILTKPFVIYDKRINYAGNSGECVYEYIDFVGRTETFRDSNNKYNIGDTIK